MRLTIMTLMAAALLAAPLAVTARSAGAPDAATATAPTDLSAAAKKKKKKTEENLKAAPSK